jgi:hypothetical protein
MFLILSLHWNDLARDAASTAIVGQKSPLLAGAPGDVWAGLAGGCATMVKTTGSGQSRFIPGLR